MIFQLASRQFFGGKPFNVDLSGPGNAQPFFRHPIGDGAACADVGVVPYRHRGHQVGVAADECAVADGAAIFMNAVIVDGDTAAAEVDVLPYVRIPHIG